MKNELQIQIIMPERGKGLTLLGTNKYRFIRQRKYGQGKWLCTHRTFYASR